MENNTEEICLKKTTKKRKNAWKNTESIKYCVKVNVITNFTRDEVKSYTDDNDDFEEDRVILFK